MPWASSRRLHRLHRLQTAGNAAAAQRRRATSARAAEQRSRSLPANGWTCTCGQRNTGKFCSACGKPRPAEGWTCACGTVNQGKFCQNCGAKKPANEPQYRCDKCGWQPEDPRHPPKFCPECGDPFDFNDQV